MDVSDSVLDRGRGDVVSVACANGNVLVATSRGYIVRFHWDAYDSEKGKIPAGL